MCGRYVTVSKIKTIEKRFNVKADQPELFIPNTNVSHGDYAPVITNDAPGKLQFFQFGFTPFWAKKQFYMINARAEGDHNKENAINYSGAKGIIDKPMFRKSIRSKRCLVLADAFIEGPEKAKLNEPHVVYLKNQERPFALAGIWDTWKSEDKEIHSFAIITTVANRLMTEIGHHRSPVVLEKEDERAWLNSTLPLNEVTEMLKPYPFQEMNAYPIDPQIKNPRTNGLSLLEPIGQRIFPEYEYEVKKNIELFGMGESRARKRRKEE